MKIRKNDYFERMVRWPERLTDRRHLKYRHISKRGLLNAVPSLLSLGLLLWAFYAEYNVFIPVILNRQPIVTLASDSHEAAQPHMLYDHAPKFFAVMCGGLFAVYWLLSVSHFIRVFTTDNCPSSYTKTQTLQDGKVVTTTEDGTVLHGLKCAKCEGFKPDRCHHCRICGRCCLKMDHHCLFLFKKNPLFFFHVCFLWCCNRSLGWLLCWVL